jgi:hypothetical protein
MYPISDRIAPHRIASHRIARAREPRTIVLFSRVRTRGFGLILIVQNLPTDIVAVAVRTLERSMGGRGRLID